MKNKQVKNLICEYRQIPRTNQSEDLSKVEYPANSSKKSLSIKRKALWCGIACVLIACITLSIYLPLQLSKSKKGAPTQNDNTEPQQTEPQPIDNQPHYFDSEQLLYSSVESIEAFNENTGSTMPVPIIEAIDCTTRAISFKQDGKVIGLEVNLTVWNEIIDNALIVFYTGNDRALNSDYQSFNETAEYNSCTVSYRSVQVNELENDYYAVVEGDNIYYTVFIFAYEELPITDLLSAIFG